MSKKNNGNFMNTNEVEISQEEEEEQVKLKVGTEETGRIAKSFSSPCLSQTNSKSPIESDTQTIPHHLSFSPRKSSLSPSSSSSNLNSNPTSPTSPSSISSSKGSPRLFGARTIHRNDPNKFIEKVPKDLNERRQIYRQSSDPSHSKNLNFRRHSSPNFFPPKETPLTSLTEVEEPEEPLSPRISLLKKPIPSRYSASLPFHGERPHSISPIYLEKHFFDPTSPLQSPQSPGEKYIPSPSRSQTYSPPGVLSSSIETLSTSSGSNSSLNYFPNSTISPSNSVSNLNTSPVNSYSTSYMPSSSTSSSSSSTTTLSSSNSSNSPFSTSSSSSSSTSSLIVNTSLSTSLANVNLSSPTVLLSPFNPLDSGFTSTNEQIKASQKRFQMRANSMNLSSTLDGIDENEEEMQKFESFRKRSMSEGNFEGMAFGRKARSLSMFWSQKDKEEAIQAWEEEKKRKGSSSKLGSFLKGFRKFKRKGS